LAIIGHADRQSGALDGARRSIVIAVAGLVGVAAVYGGVMLLADPTGLGVKQEWLDGSPFGDYTLPGVVLLVGIGGGMLLTAAAAIMRHRNARAAARAMAVVLLIWGAVETATIGYRGTPQLVLVAVWVVAPALALLIACAPPRGRRP
jgi:hypothetical protein